MTFVRPLARACRAVPLVLIVSAGTAEAAPYGGTVEAAQIALSANGQQLNNLIGRGVALADFNGDGALDAFVVNQVTWESHDARVYLGDGRGQFADSAQRLTAPGPADQPLVLDVDGNGTKDVLVGRVTWVNDGKGRFTAGPSVLDDADGARVRDARLADLNGDGAVNLLAPVMPGPGGAAGIRLYLNDGKGRFRAAGQTPLPGITSAVGIGDLDGKGTPDVVVSGWRNKAKDDCPNRVLLNDGKGRLTDTGRQLDEELRHSHGLALGDFDGDRDLDVMIVAQGTPPGGHVYLNDGKGRFTSGPRIGTTSIENVALADFDGDGDLDVFLACIGPDEVWLNDGRGLFTDSTLRLGTAWSWQLAVGDVNGDRLPDVFVVSFTNDRTLPPDRSLVAHPADVWLNTSRRESAPAGASGTAGRPMPAGDTRADRYARDLQRARAAVAGRDHAAALAAYERLIREAPYHPGFHYQIARLSALTGQPARAADELERALALGHDFGEKLDDAFATLGAQAATPKTAAPIQRSRRPVGTSRVAFTLAERDLTPEGIAYDPKDGAFYLGSTWGSKIVRLFLNRTGDAMKRTAVLENRHPSFELPTTGAMAGRSFYYMANTQIYRTGAGGKLLPVEKLDDLIILRLDVDAPAAGTR